MNTYQISDTCTYLPSQTDKYIAINWIVRVLRKHTDSGRVMSSGVIGRQGLVHHGRSLVESLRCATVLSYSTNRNIVDGIDGTVMPVHFGPGRVAAQDSQEGIATVGGRVQFMEKWHSGLGLLEMMQTKPKDALGLYVDLPSKGPPEAAAEFYHHPELTKAKVHQYNYGCKGAMQEFDLSGKHMCIMRPSMQEVLETVMESEPGAVLDMVVDGWKGSGKSMTLYALASAAREAGWIVMYVPSASLLVRGGIYKKKEEEEQEWYTPVAAHHMLKAVMDMHSSELEKLPSLDAKGSLAQQCKRAIETDDYFEKVDGAVALLQGLLHGDGVNGLRTLVIVDEYNYLYSRTEYHEVRFSRGNLDTCVCGNLDPCVNLDTHVTDKMMDRILLLLIMHCGSMCRRCTASIEGELNLKNLN